MQIVRSVPPRPLQQTYSSEGVASINTCITLALKKEQPDAALIDTPAWEHLIDVLWFTDTADARECLQVMYVYEEWFRNGELTDDDRRNFRRVLFRIMFFLTKIKLNLFLDREIYLTPPVSPNWQ